MPPLLFLMVVPVYSLHGAPAGRDIAFFPFPVAYKSCGIRDAKFPQGNPQTIHRDCGNRNQPGSILYPFFRTSFNNSKVFLFASSGDCLEALACPDCYHDNPARQPSVSASVRNANRLLSDSRPGVCPMAGGTTCRILKAPCARTCRSRKTGGFPFRSGTSVRAASRTRG